jgi:hypothetical protein
MRTRLEEEMARIGTDRYPEPPTVDLVLEVAPALDRGALQLGAAWS